MNILEKIAAYKRDEVASAKATIPLLELRNRAEDMPPTLGFAQALDFKERMGQFGLIAEIKKASPSKGLIRADFNPTQHALDYAEGGACCLSILTDAPSFQGSAEYLKDVRKISLLPILRKDFMLDLYQVYEARVWGADCILIIMAMVDDALAKDLALLSLQIGLDALVEVHDEWEMERALNLGFGFVGINNRNLKTFETSLDTTLRLSKMAQGLAHLVCESGLNTHDDLVRMSKDARVSSFLIGESLMREADIVKATQIILGSRNVTL